MKKRHILNKYSNSKVLLECPNCGGPLYSRDDIRWECGDCRGTGFIKNHPERNNNGEGELNPKWK